MLKRLIDRIAKRTSREVLAVIMDHIVDGTITPNKEKAYNNEIKCLQDTIENLNKRVTSGEWIFDDGVYQQFDDDYADLPDWPYRKEKAAFVYCTKCYRFTNPFGKGRICEIPAEHFDPNYMRFCPVCGSANGMNAEQKEQFYGYLHGKGADLDPRKLYALNDDGTYTEIAAEMEDGEDGK